MVIELPMLRNSERNDLKQCQKKWYWTWELGLEPIFQKQNALWFGTGIHLALAEYYTPPKGTEKNPKRGFIRGRHPVETWKEFAKDSFALMSATPYFDQEAEREFLSAIDLGELMLNGYLVEYGADDHWEMLIPEQRFSAKIPYNARQLRANADLPDYILRLFPDDKYITRAVGTFDAPVRDHSDYGKVKIIDHKTAIKKESGAHLVKDDQGGTYIALATSALRAMGLIKPKENVSGMIFNYLRKSGPPTDKLLDEQGRVRNQPKKDDYINAIVSHFSDNEEMVNQTGFDFTAVKKMPISSTKEGAMTLSAIATVMNLTVLGEVSKLQPAPLFWREDVIRTRAAQLKQFERIADDAEHIALLRGGLIAPMKNPDKHCAWCPFNDLCDIDEDGGDTEQFIKDAFKIRDPYADHREGALNSKESVSADKTAKA